MESAAGGATHRRKKSRFGDARPSEVTAGLTAGVPAAANAAATAAVQTIINQNLLGLPNTSELPLKARTELFVGNIPAGCESATLMEFLNAAMIAVNLNIDAGNPVTDVRISAKFAFIVLRTPEETTNALNLTGIPYNESVLKVERPAGYPGVKTGVMTWAQLASGERPPDPSAVQEHAPTGVGADLVTSGTALALLSATNGADFLGNSAVDPATKPARELFVGNINESANGEAIKEFLGSVMSEVGLSDANLGGNPIMNIRVSPKFAFIELRSVEETSNALNMDGIPYNDLELRIKRPEKYPGNPTPSVSWREFLEHRNETLAGHSTTISLSGRTLVRPGELEASEESFSAFIEDVRAECSKHGTVIECSVYGSPVKALVKFETADEAQTAVTELSKLAFAGENIAVEILKASDSYASHGTYGDYVKSLD